MDEYYLTARRRNIPRPTRPNPKRDRVRGSGTAVAVNVPDQVFVTDPWVCNVWRIVWYGTVNWEVKTIERLSNSFVEMRRAKPDAVIDADETPPKPLTKLTAEPGTVQTCPAAGASPHAVAGKTPLKSVFR